MDLRAVDWKGLVGWFEGEGEGGGRREKGWCVSQLKAQRIAPALQPLLHPFDREE